MEPTERPENPLGRASAVISIAGLTVCLLTVGCVYALELKRSAISEKLAIDASLTSGLMLIGYLLLV